MDYLISSIFLAYFPIVLSEYTIPRMLLVCILASICCIKSKNRELNVAEIILLIFVSFSIISTVLSQDVETSVLGKQCNYDFGLLAIFAWTSIYLFCKFEDWAIITPCTIMAVIGIGQWLPAHNAALPWIGRSTSIVGSPVLLGNLLAIAFVFSFAKREYWKSAIMALCLLGTICRGALLGSVFGLYLYSYLCGINRRLHTLSLIIICCTGYIASMNRDTSLSDSMRIEAWRVALIEIENHPYFGVGPEAIGLSYRREMSPDFLQESPGRTSHENAHNDILHIGANLGIPAVIAYLLFVIVVARRLYLRQKFAELSALFAAFVAAKFNPMSICSMFAVVLLAGRDNE